MTAAGQVPLFCPPPVTIGGCSNRAPNPQATPVLLKSRLRSLPRKARFPKFSFWVPGKSPVVPNATFGWSVPPFLFDWP